MNTKTDYLYEIYHIKKVTEAKKYLNNLKSNIQVLDKKTKEKHINILNQMSFTNNIASILSQSKYKVFEREEAIRKLIIDQFLILNIKNYNMIIDDLTTVLSSLTEKHNTTRIFKKDIKNIFKVIETKIPNFTNILKEINLDILIFNNTDKKVNSASIPSENMKNFKIMCYYMKDEEEYRQGMVNPIYVFLHELGHIICWLITKEFKKVPPSFFEEIGKYMNGLEQDNPDAPEVYADSFAMAMIYNSSLNCYNVFYGKFLKQLFIDLEQYFIKTISTTIIKEYS